MKRILITGASGFLGSALALYLLEKGCRPGLLLRPTSRLDRLNGLESEFDICRCGSKEEISAFVSKFQPDVVIHTACSYGRAGESNLQILEANVSYGLIILQQLLDSRKNTTFINTGTVLAPDVSPYAMSKHHFAEWGRTLANQSSSLRFINVQLQHMYGQGDDPSKFTTHVLHACYRNDPALELTAGEQLRDFIFIDDVVSAYALLVDKCENIEPYLDIGLGSGVAQPVRQFVETVHSIVSSGTELLFGALPYRTNEAMHCQADISRFRALGWQPKYTLETGLRKTIELEFSK